MRRWIITYAASCAGCVVVVLGALWAFNDFQGLGIGWVGTLALLSGIVVTVTLGILLMGLVFASDRGGADERAHWVPPEEP